MIAFLLFLILAIIICKILFNMTVTVIGGILGIIIVVIISIIAKKRRN